MAVAATITAVILGLVVPATAGAQAEGVRTELAAGQQTDADVNKSLDSMAKLFAAAVTDKDLRQQIHDGAAQRFDGDTNVLYKTLSNTSGVRQALATEYSQERAAQPSDALSAVDRLASDIPRFQVAVPVNFNAWDPASYTPLVAYRPVGVEDTTAETITAYDATGKAHELDAQVAPDQPVIVLGLNERIDDSGRLANQEPEPVSSDPPAASGSAEPVDDVVAGPPTVLASNYRVEVAAVHLIDARESWSGGEAEIHYRAKSVCGDLYDEQPEWDALREDGDKFSWNSESTNRYVGTTTCDVVFYWWEDDSGSFDFRLEFETRRGTISLGANMANEDDLIGGRQVDHSVFAGVTNHPRRWDDLDMWVE